MRGFLFDENTPRRLTFSPGLPVCHSKDLGDSPSDTEIWNYARREELVIVSKDADFSNRIMLSNPPPWIVRLRFGNPEAAARRLKALEPYPLLDASPSAFKLADEFIRPGAMPAKAKDDSLHLAICAVHAVQFLLTWNFRHIANAETRNVLREICTRKGYPFPTICTPDEMMKGTI